MMLQKQVETVWDLISKYWNRFLNGTGHDCFKTNNNQDFFFVAGQRTLCIGCVQNSAGRVEKPGPEGPWGSPDPEGFAPGGIGHNPGQNVWRITGV